MKNIMKNILIIMLFISLYAFELPDENPITNRCVDIVDISPEGEVFSIIKTKIKNKNSIENLRIFCPIRKINKISIVNKNDEEIENVKRIGNVVYPKFEKINKNARFKIEYQMLDGEEKIEYSDTFCIKPYKFVFEIPNNIYEGNMVTIKYKTIDYIGNDTSYKDEVKLKGEGLQYSIHKHYFYALFRDGKHYLILYDEHFCDIDKNDTSLKYRMLSGSLEVNVKPKSKYWGGVGTNEVENKPTKNTINSDIKQNIFKDMKFNKISW